MATTTDIRDVPPVLSALAAIKLLVGVCALWSILLGGSILATAADSWPPDPRFATALRLPGAPESWGAIAVLCGLTIIVGLAFHRRVLQIAGLLTSGVWCLSLGIAYGWEFFAHGVGDSGAPVGYVIAALFYLVLACAHLPRHDW